MEAESNEELAFLDTLSKRKNGNISVLVYKKLPYTEHYSSHNQTSSMQSAVCSLFNRYSIITSTDEFTKKITNNHSLSQLQQQMQATDTQEEENRISKSQLNVC